MEKIILDSGVVRIPIGIIDKNNPSEIHDTFVDFDYSDKGIAEAQKRNANVKKEIDSLAKKYSEQFGGDVTDENVSDVVASLSNILEVRFDDDFGKGKYQEIANLGGGNSFLNMYYLYSEINDRVADILEQKTEKLKRKSENKKAKYLKRKGK